MISKPKYQVELEPKIQTQFTPEVSLATYESLIKDREIEEEVIKKLNLDRPPYEFTPDSLQGMITIESLKNTNLIKMNLQAGEPKLAKDIANVWASLFVEKNKNLNLLESKEAQRFIEEQLKISNQNLSKIEEEIREFNETDKIEIVENEIKGKAAKILNHELRIADIKISLKKEKARKEQVIISLNEQDKVLKLSKSITNDQFFHQLMSKITNGNFSDINLTYVSEEANPIYYNLAQQLICTDILINSLQAEEKQLKENIDNYWERIESLKQELAQEKLTQLRLEREYNTAKGVYGVLSQKNEEVKIAVATESGLVKIASLAYEPRFPIKPNKKLNILIAGVLGLFVGIFVAFFLEFWQKGKK
jgi:capsular polysaccharide biosynthesis protein